jgi:predicted outer membrane protein
VSGSPAAAPIRARHLQTMTMPNTIMTLALLLLLGQVAAADTTLPRQRDANPVQQRAAGQENPTDPLFDRQFVATDDPAFVLGAIESSRQGVIDARSAAELLRKEELRKAATSIERQNEATRTRLETLAKRKGWRMPESNPQRATTLPASGDARTAADFIVNQISYHETTLAQFRAQLGGQGDAELKRALSDSLPGYQKNLDLLLRLKL